jgi:DNA-binding NtrC family response regulator
MIITPCMSKTIFVIDDDPVYRKFMESHFNLMEGFTVRLFSGGQEAMDQLHEPPYLVMLDHHLNEPDRCGLDYLQVIRKRHPSVPVLYMSSDTTSRLIEKSQKLGAYAFLAKDQAFLVRLRTLLDTLLERKSGKGFWRRIFGGN